MKIFDKIIILFDKALMLVTLFFLVLFIGIFMGASKNIDELRINKHYLHTDTLYIHNADSAILMFLIHHGFKYPARIFHMQSDSIQTKLLNNSQNWKYNKSRCQFDSLY